MLLFRLRREQRKRCGFCILFLCFPPILNRGTFAGTKVQGWEALPPNHILLPDQLWKVQYTGKPGIDSYTISNLKSGTYLENKGGNVNNGAPFTSSRWAVAGGQITTDQEWELIKTSANGYYKIRNVASQTYLDLDKRNQSSELAGTGREREPALGFQPRQSPSGLSGAAGVNANQAENFSSYTPFLVLNLSCAAPELNRPITLVLDRIKKNTVPECKSHSSSDTLYKRLADKDYPKLRVIGFNDDTKAVFRTCNPDGHEYVEVPWSGMDSLKWIAQRLEDEIRVALHHWVIQTLYLDISSPLAQYLATADGVIFTTFGELVCTSAAFRVKEQVVLTLLMPTDLSTFAASHLKQHKWKHTTAVSCASTDAMEKCVAQFHLIDPKPSTAWNVYFAQRSAADKHVQDQLNEYVGQDRPPVYEKIEKAVDRVLDCLALGDGEPSVHDCVVPLLADLVDDGWGNVASAELLSRVYSPTNTAAVDVYLEYHYRTHYQSVEFFCNVYYRAQPSITEKKLTLSTPRGPSKMNGFRPLLQMGLADMPPGRRWRAIEERTFDLSQVQAHSLHRVLFGEASASASGSESDPSKGLGLAKKISVREMIELLLASVGISFYTAFDPDDEDDVDSFKMGELRWEGLDGSARWLGRNIRSVSGCVPMNDDNKDSDKENGDYDEDEDEYSDEDDGDFGGERGGCQHQ
ncbi:hypothetical protein K438DRAFT_1784649 [Mycena galopus ATCC 62051]|nr:hypothetical protein K438DRAFT_1784649 [Mycena galopus ATCC 62051]